MSERSCTLIQIQRSFNESSSQSRDLSETRILTLEFAKSILAWKTREISLVSRKYFIVLMASSFSDGPTKRFILITKESAIEWCWDLRHISEFRFFCRNSGADFEIVLWYWIIILFLLVKLFVKQWKSCNSFCKLAEIFFCFPCRNSFTSKTFRFENYKFQTAPSKFWTSQLYRCFERRPQIHLALKLNPSARPPNRFGTFWLSATYNVECLTYYWRMPLLENNGLLLLPHRILHSQVLSLVI